MPREASKRAAAGWVRRVQQTSDAMDIPLGLFTKPAPEIARGLKRAVLTSSRTKGTKFQSAMSMLNWFINRGGRGLSKERRQELEQAKVELRKIFGRPAMERGAVAGAAIDAGRRRPRRSGSRQPGRRSRGNRR